MTEIRDLQHLGSLARTYRRRAGLTQAKAAGLLGYSRKWLSDFECGRTDPPVSMVFRLMRGLGIPLAVIERSHAASPVDEEEIELDVDQGL